MKVLHTLRIEQSVYEMAKHWGINLSAAAQKGIEDAITSRKAELKREISEV